MKKIFFSLWITLMLMLAITSIPALAGNAADSSKAISSGEGEPISLEQLIIDAPPNPPPGYEQERAPVAPLPSNPARGTNTLTVPAYKWSLGCAPTVGSMIAAYYDRSGYSKMYQGSTNGGVMPLDSSPWPTWTDGSGDTYAQCPLTASRNGLDGRTTRGTIDDYWVEYGSSAQDPYITGGWEQHDWGESIGDYMKTGQAAYDNLDGYTSFYYLSSSGALTCAAMVNHHVDDVDGTYGRKLFYEARGYTVTDCYNQKTDNNGGGFTYAMYKAEIDAGHPVMLNLNGHSVVGTGYNDPSTVYLHDTWDYDTHSMTWGGSYSGRKLLAVSIVNLQSLPASPTPTVTRTTVVPPTRTPTPTLTRTTVAPATRTRTPTLTRTTVAPATRTRTPTLTRTTVSLDTRTPTPTLTPTRPGTTPTRSPTPTSTSLPATGTQLHVIYLPLVLKSPPAR